MREETSTTRIISYHIICVDQLEVGLRHVLLVVLSCDVTRRGVLWCGVVATPHENRGHNLGSLSVRYEILCPLSTNLSLTSHTVTLKHYPVVYLLDLTRIDLTCVGLAHLTTGALNIY